MSRKENGREEAETQKKGKNRSNTSESPPSSNSLSLLSPLSEAGGGSKQMGLCENAALICNCRESKELRYFLSQADRHTLTGTLFTPHSLTSFNFLFPSSTSSGIKTSQHVSFRHECFSIDPFSYIPCSFPLTASPPLVQTSLSASDKTAYLLHKGCRMDATAQ